MKPDGDMYTEGSVYYYENISRTKKDYDDKSINHDFLVSRPVYVLRSNPVPFHVFTVNVLAITTSMDRPGISINIDGTRPSKILPYATHSLHPEYLKEYMGKMPDEIIAEVNTARLYHDGYTTKKPQYLIEYEEREIKLSNIYDKMPLRERIIFQFFKKACAVQETYFVSQDELLACYRIFAKNYAYERTTDFTKGFAKILAMYPEVKRRKEGSSYIYYGIGIEDHLQDITQPMQRRNANQNREHEKRKKKYKKINLKHHCKENDPLIERISVEAFNAYQRMDIIEKIDGYRKTITFLDLPGCPREDLPLIKQMIENEVNQLKKKIFRMLDNGENPLNMTDTYQFVLHVCTNAEVLEHCQSKYVTKAGGIRNLRKTIRNNVKHYFSRMRM